MQRLNRDVVAAIFLLLLCGVFFWASFDIRQPDYGTLMPSTWPRIIIGVLSLLSLVYLVQALRGEAGDDEAEPAAPRAPGFAGWLAHWRNPIYCFAAFFAFLASLPVLGMLIGGVAFVFVLMSLLGGWAPRRLALHAAIAVATVGAMWSLFTFGLGVILPPGVLFNPFG